MSYSGITKEQLYSTASYQQKNLGAIVLANNDLTDWDLSGQDLTNANLYWATVTDADLTGAIVTGASFSNTTSRGFTKEQLYSTASYQQNDLQGISLGSNDLTGWDFSGQDLTGAYFANSTLTNTNFAEAIVAEANFAGTTSLGFTKEQLYSTASYQQKNLRGVGLGAYWSGGNDLTHWDLSGQDLTDAQIERTSLTGANLAGANLTNASLRESTLTSADLTGANLTNAYLSMAALGGANLTGADLRGARSVNLTGAIVTNAIHKDGAILGLDLGGGDELVVRDYDGYSQTRPPIPITVLEHFAMAGGAVLRMVFESDPWDSLVSFEPGIPVELGGTLQLAFTEDVAVTGQVGRTLHVFDWSGVTPTGAFAVHSPYQWDVSQLYTTGEVTLLAVPEPSALLLFLCGLVTPLSRQRRITAKIAKRNKR